MLIKIGCKICSESALLEDYTLCMECYTVPGSKAYCKEDGSHHSALPLVSDTSGIC